MFLFLFRLLLFLFSRLYLKTTFLYPPFFNAVSYSTFGASNIFAFEEFLGNLSLTVYDNFFIICSGWFEFLLIYNSELLGFSLGLYEPFIKLNVISKKSAIFKFVLMSVLKAISLKILIIFLRTWSICRSFMYSCIIKPSSL